MLVVICILGGLKGVRMTGEYRKTGGNKCRGGK